MARSTLEDQRRHRSTGRRDGIPPAGGNPSPIAATQTLQGFRMNMTRPHTWAVTWLASAAVLGLCGPVFAQQRPALKIGVTLHPYYSWTRNVVGDLPGYEVRSILPGEIDAGDYQPRPDDIKKLVDLDALVVNGIGHDDFIMPMLKASGNKKVVIIRPNETTPQLHAVRGTSVNS